MKNNVVGVTSGNGTGFGFIVGIDGPDLLIATAYHTVSASSDGSASVCYADGDRPCASASVKYVADAIGSLPQIDLAILATAWPEGLLWRPDLLAPRPSPGTPARFIGRSQAWYIPEEPGRVTAYDADRQLLSYVDLDVAEGVSGAPIVTDEGIVAMHIESDGRAGEARGIDIHDIRSRIEDSSIGTFLLVAPASCEQHEPHRRALEDRAINVHFDAQGPDAGIAAVALLNCIGAHARPSPVWNDEAWPGAHVVYPSGDVRAARAVQSVLAPLGRLETRLGDTSAALEVWIR